jgi:hypothetical protein
MGMRRVLVVAAMAAVVVGCGGGGATQAPGGGGGGGPTQAPGAQATPAPSTGSSGGGGGGGGGGSLGGVDPAGLAKVPTAKVCTLLSRAEAGAILGGSVDDDPSGMTLDGLGTNCLYYSGGVGGPSIKIEFNTLGYDAEVKLLAFGGDSQQLTVAGRPAVALPKKDPNSFLGAQLEVSLVDDPKAIGLYVEAPTVDMAVKAAETVLPRISGLQ